MSLDWGRTSSGPRLEVKYTGCVRPSWAAAGAHPCRRRTELERTHLGSLVMRQGSSGSSPGIRTVHLPHTHTHTCCIRMHVRHPTHYISTASLPPSLVTSYAKCDELQTPKRALTASWAA